MFRTIQKTLISTAMVCLPALAQAGPGSSAISTTVTPQNLPAVVAAIDKWMASDVGRQFKGRLVLLSHIADGADPATNTIVSVYHSVAEFEAFSKLTANSPAYAELLNTVVPISQVTFTGRSSAVKSWGDVNDTDTVWENFLFTVTDPAAVIAATDAWNASAMGKKFPGQTHLSMVDAGGIGPATHFFAVGWASLAEREAFNDANRNDPAWATYLAAMQKASTFLGSSLSQTVKAWGPATTQSLTP